MSDVDGLLEKTKARCHRNMEHGCNTIAVTTHEMIDIIATIEQQRAEIELLRSQLSPRCSIPADMELDDVIVRFTNRTDDPC